MAATMDRRDNSLIQEPKPRMSIDARRSGFAKSKKGMLSQSLSQLMQATEDDLVHDEQPLRGRSRTADLTNHLQSSRALDESDQCTENMSDFGAIDTLFDGLDSVARSEQLSTARPRQLQLPTDSKNVPASTAGACGSTVVSGDLATTGSVSEIESVARRAPQQSVSIREELQLLTQMRDRVATSMEYRPDFSGFPSKVHNPKRTFLPTKIRRADVDDGQDQLAELLNSAFEVWKNKELSSPASRSATRKHEYKAQKKGMEQTMDRNRVHRTRGVKGNKSPRTTRRKETEGSDTCMEDRPSRSSHSRLELNAKSGDEMEQRRSRRTAAHSREKEEGASSRRGRRSIDKQIESQQQLHEAPAVAKKSIGGKKKVRNSISSKVKDSPATPSARKGKISSNQKSISSRKTRSISLAGKLTEELHREGKSTRGILHRRSSDDVDLEMMLKAYVKAKKVQDPNAPDDRSSGLGAASIDFGPTLENTRKSPTPRRRATTTDLDVDIEVVRSSIRSDCDTDTSPPVKSMRKSKSPTPRRRATTTDLDVEALGSATRKTHEKRRSSDIPSTSIPTLSSLFQSPCQPSTEKTATSCSNGVRSKSPSSKAMGSSVAAVGGRRRSKSRRSTTRDAADSDWAVLGMKNAPSTTRTSVTSSKLTLPSLDVRKSISKLDHTLSTNSSSGNDNPSEPAGSPSDNCSIDPTRLSCLAPTRKSSSMTFATNHSSLSEFTKKSRDTLSTYLSNSQSTLSAAEEQQQQMTTGCAIGDDENDENIEGNNPIATIGYASLLEDSDELDASAQSNLSSSNSCVADDMLPPAYIHRKRAATDSGELELLTKTPTSAVEAPSVDADENNNSFVFTSEYFTEDEQDNDNNGRNGMVVTKTVCSPSPRRKSSTDIEWLQAIEKRQQRRGSSTAGNGAFSSTKGHHHLSSRHRRSSSSKCAS